MNKFLVYQSLWAMERRRPDGVEWTLDEKLDMIRTAGFDGCGVRFADRDFVRTVTLGARDANADLTLLAIGSQGLDHPTPAAFPEGRYLKCLFFRVVR